MTAGGMHFITSATSPPLPAMRILALESLHMSPRQFDSPPLGTAMALRGIMQEPKPSIQRMSTVSPLLCIYTPHADLPIVDCSFGL